MKLYIDKGNEKQITALLAADGWGEIDFPGRQDHLD